MDWRGWRKLAAFLVVCLVAALKLDGPDLVQALTWSIAAFMGGNVGEYIGKRPSQIIVNNSPGPDAADDLDMSDMPNPVGFTPEE